MAGRVGIFLPHSAVFPRNRSSRTPTVSAAPAPDTVPPRTGVSTMPFSIPPAPIPARRAAIRPVTGWGAIAALFACLLTGLGASPARAASTSNLPANAPVAASSGGTVHVCVDARGQREFRDAPCGAHQRSLRAIAFERVPAASAPQGRSHEVVRGSGRRVASADTPVGRMGEGVGASRKRATPSRRDDACQRARSRRDDAHQRAPSGLSFDQWRRLDRDVWSRCQQG